MYFIIEIFGEKDNLKSYNFTHKYPTPPPPRTTKSQEVHGQLNPVRSSVEPTQQTYVGLGCAIVFQGTHFMNQV